MRLKLKPDFSRARAAAKMELAQVAAFRRRQGMTAAYGQEEIYEAKYAEAVAYLDGSPAGPMITEESAIRGVTVDQMAQMIVDARAARDDLWRRVEMVRIEHSLIVDATRGEDAIKEATEAGKTALMAV